MLTANGQIEANRTDLVVTTVTELSSHIAAASVKLGTLSDTEADAETIGAEFGQHLHDHAKSLTELQSTSAPATQEIIQSAFEAVDEAQQRLDRGAQPAMHDPQPDPAQRESKDPPSDSPTQPLPAGGYSIDAASATLTNPAERQGPASSNQLDGNVAPSALPGTRTGRESAANATTKNDATPIDTDMPDAEVRTVEQQGVVAGEAPPAGDTSPAPEPQRESREASTAPNSALQFALEPAEQQEASRPSQEPLSPTDAPPISEQPLPAQPESEDTQAPDESLPETGMPNVRPEGTPRSENGNVPGDGLKEGRLEQQADGDEDGDVTPSSETDLSDDPDESDSAPDDKDRSSQEAPAEAKHDRPDSKQATRGK